MLTYLRQLLAPPVFDGDEAKTYAASLLNTVLFSVLLGTILYGVASPIAITDVPLRLAYVSFLVGLVLSLIFVMRRGQVRLAASVIVVGLWAVLTVAAITSSGVTAPAFNGYIVVILCAGLLIGARAAVGWALASIGAGGVMLYMEGRGLMRPSALPDTLTALWLAQAVYFLVAAVLLTLALRSITRALQRARQEINDRQQAEAALRRSEARLKTITDNAPDLIFQLDRAGRIVYLNRVAPGLRAEDVLGVEATTWIPEAYRPIMTKALGDVFATGEPQEYETLGTGPHGQLSWYRSRIAPVWSGEVVDSAIVITRDVTEHKRTEEALRKGEERFRTVLDNLGEGVCVQNSEWRYTYANPAAHAILGWPPGTLIGHSEEEVLPPAGNLIVKRENLRRQAGQITSYETDIVRPNGEIRTVLSTGVPHLDAQGQLVETFVAFTDITERLRSEAALRRSEALYRRAIEAAEAVPYQLDYGREAYTFIGAGIEALVGLKPEAMAPSTWDAIVLETVPLGENANLTKEEALQRNRSGQTFVWKADYQVRTPTGALKWLTDSAVKVLDEAGRPQGTIGILQDITDRKQALDDVQRLNTDLEQRVRERTMELEAANQDLEAFLYSVSHDLRAPLRAVDGFSRLVLEEHAHGLEPEGAYYMRRVRESVHRMGLLIDDLLEFSRLGRLALQARRLTSDELLALVQTSVDELRASARDQAVEVVIGDLPACQADPALLKQVWVNLLSNAFKYSRTRLESQIQVGSQLTPAGQAYFVRDNGVGFDMRYVHKLFGVFQRLHAETEFEGTGVGLAIVHRIIHKHGGQIWAEAAPGAGATFYFTLP